MKEPQLYRVGTLTYTKSALGRLYFWLLWGDFTYFMVESVVPSAIPLKFKHLDASNFLMGIVLATVPKIIGGIFNPVVSFRSDRFRSRWGRRIPFIAATMPFLVLCFLGLAFVDDIGPWLGRTFPALGHTFTNNILILIVLSIFLIAFDFFNTFVTSVFWYLFNDVVPEQLISRFTSWFRMVIMVTGMLYNELVFPYVESHFKEIFIGAAVLYFFGFGSMCLFVKEGEYPPPPQNTDGATGPVAALKTYARECMTLPHYWYLFLIGIFGTLAGACGMFSIFFQKITMGLNLHQIGWLAVAGAITCFFCVPVAGWMGDRFHPIRVVLWGTILAWVVSPINFIWLFWRPDPWTFYYCSLAQTVFLGCPIGMMCQMDFPMLMRLLPKERFGQYSSCRVLLTSIVGIFSGALGGAFLDIMTKHYGEKTAYCFIPFWSFVFSTASLFFMYKLYVSWKYYGGDESYVPPMPVRAPKASVTA